MVFHLFKSRIRVFWLLDADNLYLVELMQTVETADILAVGPCLATEACRVGTVFLRELFAGDDDIAIDIGHRHLGGRDHVEFVFVDEIHLAFLVRQLSCAIAGGLVHHVGRLDFKISGIAGTVKEELDESALQTGALADIHREAGACDLDSEIEVDDIVILGKFPVRERIGRKFGHRTAGFLHHIVLSAFAFRHCIARNIGHTEQNVTDGILGHSQTVGHFFLCGFDFRYLFLGLVSLVAAAFFHQTADRIGILFQFGCQSVVLILERAALVIEINNIVDSLFSVKSFDGEARYNAFGILFDLLKGKHLCCNVW